jgi:orotate phosphoribosyltransferase
MSLLPTENISVSKADLAKRIYAVSHLTGTFLLRSGQTSNHYFDKYQFESDPLLLADIARLASPLIPKETEVLAGLELGGVALAVALSMATGLPTAFVRKKAKEYGTRRLCEGADVSGKHVLIVEDVITSGGQVLLSGKDLRELGATVTHVLCAIDREQGGREALAAERYAMVSLFTNSELTPNP